MTKPLSQNQGLKLTQLARKSLENKLLGAGHDLEILKEEAFLKSAGVFVTLYLYGNLKGCIGNIDPVENIFKSVCRLSLDAAFQDYRFESVTANDLNQLKIEVSLLSPKKEVLGPDPISRAKAIHINVDGVVLEKEGKKSTFLPQVWESLPELEGFLSHLSAKAGLLEDAWQEEDARLYTYQVQYFNEE